MREEDINYWIYAEVIVPEVLMVRERIFHQCTSIDISKHSEYFEKFGPICILQDGAHGQIQAIEKKLFQMCQDNDLLVLFAKYSAGCSMIQSPNDKGPMHANLHRLFKNDFFSREVAEPVTGSWVELKTVLQDRLDSASFQTMWKSIIHAPIYLSRSFHAGSIQSAYDKAGVYLAATRKYFPQRILSHFPYWSRLSDHQAEYVLGQLPYLADMFRQYHYIPEEIFDEVLEDLEQEIGVHQKEGKPLNDLVTNRQRCLILGQNSLMEHQSMRIEDQLSQKIRECTRKETKKSKKNRKICSNWECLSDIPMNDSSWLKCPHKSCRKLCCGREACYMSFERHKLAH